MKGSGALRQTMTMRASIARRGAGALIPHLTAVPCIAQYTGGREVVREGMIATVKNLHILFPAGTAINDADTIVTIADRLGVTLYSDLDVTLIQDRGAYVDALVAEAG